MSSEFEKISFVLPVYDEEGNLRELHRKIVEVMNEIPFDYEMVFVDDGSADKSLEVMAELQKEDPRVRVVQLRRNFGKAAAYSAGFDNVRGDIVITMDTDLQDDPAEIPLFLEKMREGFDMVSGWKYQGKGPANKRIPSKIFNRVVRAITGVQLHDFNCPFKAYRRPVLDEINLYGELHRYIPVLASAEGFTLTEIKVSNLPRGSGRSKFGIERHIRGLLDLLTIIFITRFSKRPMHLLGLSGLLACSVGFGVLAFFTVAHLFYVFGVLSATWEIRDRPMLSLGILLMVVGVQFFSIGMLGELMVKSSGKTGSGKPYSVKAILEAPSEEGEKPQEPAERSPSLGAAASNRKG